METSVLQRMKSDPRYKRGRDLSKNKRLDEAVDYWGNLLEVIIEQHDAESLEAAPFYVEYGNALLAKAEASADLFGDAVAKVESKEDVNQNKENLGAVAGSKEALAEDTVEEGDEGTEENGTDAKNPTGSPAQDDLELAWEMLEVARVILCRYSDPDVDEELTFVYLRLGDLSMEGGNFGAAIEDYKKCLAIRESAREKNHRAIADVHCSIGTAYLYQEPTEEKPDHKLEALKHYRQAELEMAKVIKELAERRGLSALIIQKTRSSGPSKNGKQKADPMKRVDQENADSDDFSRLLTEVSKPAASAENADVIDLISIHTELREKVQDVLSNWREESTSAGTTSIGFGQSSSTANPFQEKPISTNGSQASASASSSINHVNMVQIKKKSGPLGNPVQVQEAGLKRKAEVASNDVVKSQKL